MRLISAVSAALALALLSPLVVLAQPAPPTPTLSVPRLVNISAVFQPADGQPPAPVEVVTLSVYAEQHGGPPLWQEMQSVTVDAAGRFTVLLGASHPDGLPPGVFASGEARWMSLRFARPGEVERPRVRITSVPYALKASDAETLGGRPASDYLLAPTAGDEPRRTAGTADASAAVTAAPLVTADLVVKPGTMNFLAKYVLGGDVGDSAVFENGGAVGLGTTTPFDRFHVRFTNTTGTFAGLAVQNLGNTNSSYSGMLFYDQNGALGLFQGFNNVTHEYRINNIARDLGSNLNGSINFMLGGISRLKISSNNFNSGAIVDVDSIVRATASSNVTMAGLTFEGRRSRGSAGAPSAVLSGDTLASFGAWGYGATAYSRRAHIDMVAAEDWTDTAKGTHMRFATSAEGDGGSYAYRLSIHSSGRVGVGTDDPLDKLHVAGDIRVGVGATGCVKDSDASVIAGVCSSDARFKKDITPFAHMLEPLTALQPVHYSWRASDYPDRHFGTGRTYGLVAQDVEQVLPDLVVTDEEGYKAVNYSKLPLLTIQAVKELKAENDALKHRVAELERLFAEVVAAAARR